MSWISVEKELPVDDRTVDVTNCRVKMLPIHAYYDEESKTFLSIETLGTNPIDVTHWMPLPEEPINSQPYEKI